MLSIRLVATVRIAAWWTFAEWQTVAGHPWTLFGPISQLIPHFENNGTPTENRADGYVSDAIFFHFSGWSRDEFASRLGDELNIGSDDDIDG